MQLIVCTFSSADGADRVRKVLERLAHADSEHSAHLAVVRKIGEGRISIAEQGDWRGRLSRLSGAMVGGLTDFVYAFAGSLGPPAGLYAADETANAVSRLVHDSGFPDDALYAVGEQLAAGQSALVALIYPSADPAWLAEIEQLGGRMIAHTLPPALVERLTTEG
jgi:uncharacterized membrane protein